MKERLSRMWLSILIEELISNQKTVEAWDAREDGGSSTGRRLHSRGMEARTGRRLSPFKGRRREKYGRNLSPAEKQRQLQKERVRGRDRKMTLPSLFILIGYVDFANSLNYINIYRDR